MDIYFLLFVRCVRPGCNWSCVFGSVSRPCAVPVVASRHRDLGRRGRGVRLRLRASRGSDWRRSRCVPISGVAAIRAARPRPARHLHLHLVRFATSLEVATAFILLRYHLIFSPHFPHIISLLLPTDHRDKPQGGFERLNIPPLVFHLPSRGNAYGTTVHYLRGCVVNHHDYKRLTQGGAAGGISNLKIREFRPYNESELDERCWT